jgi:hypothetical protein
MANGPYTIYIQGTGPYQNTDPNSPQYDAEKLLKAYVDGLISQGHTIQDAGIVVGQPNPVTVSSTLTA